MYINTREANCFIVTGRNGKDTKFPCDKWGLYVREYEEPIQRRFLPDLRDDEDSDDEDENYQVCEFINKHVEGFTPHQVETLGQVQEL